MAAEEHLKSLCVRKEGYWNLLSAPLGGIRLVNKRRTTTRRTLDWPIIGKSLQVIRILCSGKTLPSSRQHTSKHVFSKATIFFSVSGTSIEKHWHYGRRFLAVIKPHRSKWPKFVVARIGDEVTVKAIEQNAAIVRLHSRKWRLQGTLSST